MEKANNELNPRAKFFICFRMNFLNRNWNSVQPGWYFQYLTLKSPLLDPDKAQFLII